MSPPVFVLGATRSGTSWLQNMLGAHPEIATPQELDLFTGYVLPWHRSWREQLPESAETWQRHRHKGLPAVLEEDDLVALGRNVVEQVHARVLALKPGAHIVVEKEPRYTVHAALILRHFPEARFVHVIRDGRDVVASLLRAASGWGRTWATGSAERAAQVWRVNVEAGRAARALTGNYTEVRFEELQRDATPLAGLFSFCGASADAGLAQEIHAAFDLGAARGRVAQPPSSFVWGGEVAKRLGRVPEEPEGFFGPGRPSAWREQLSAYDRWLVDRAAGALLVELGYAADRGWARLAPPAAGTALARRSAGALATKLRFAAGAARAELARSRRVETT